MILISRVYEIVVTSNFSNYPQGSIWALLHGLKFDVIFYLQLSAILMIPYLIIAFFNPRVALYFFAFATVLLMLGNILLLQYFSTARVPLGADLFGYSLAEIKHTVGASGELKIFPFIVIFLYLGIMFRVMLKHVYFKIKPLGVAVLTILILCSCLPFKQFQPESSKFDNEFAMLVAYNKLSFFTQSVSAYYLKGGGEDQKFTFTTIAASAEGNPFTYIDADYPFLHKETTPDMLGEYLNLGKTPPNIIFIIVESLGRAYSGEGAYLGSFTPFLDSLMQKSLYWENCLSTSGRTFQVLPSTLASVPFGDHGFAELEDKMPEHLSLISLLKKQAGYSSRFVYGGEAEFDKMEGFLNRQGIGEIIDSRKFGAGYQKLPANANGFTWGFGDHEIFRRYLQDLNTQSGTPRMDVMLTIATHDPFLVPNQENYNRKFEERLKTLKLDEKTNSFDKQYTPQLAAMLYFDESIRYFFNEVSKTKEFANTIFVITGDHRMPEIPISTQIDRFHVPLIIYSPMLKKTEKFSSIVSHFDITPSLIAMLNKANYIKRPTVAAWMGHGLDNSKGFRSLQTYPMIRNKNEIMDILSTDQFLSAQSIYDISPNLGLEPVENSSKAQQMKNELDNFLRKNNYACKNNKLIPDSLKVYYK
ncbi:LTA synthase family protein [Solitalea sp. MAHUQ-68]|uniref:LTA synthase family protein n=1 Tax=Solitalea agri TaxID=2953739 RepID=A0A9X2F5M8_9SPHI|nr:LTA synthase family protein [Solitalea agri]MCO4294619.1 LTA synthase family protein [Solitalea agri]